MSHGPHSCAVVGHSSRKAWELPNCLQCLSLRVEGIIAPSSLRHSQAELSLISSTSGGGHHDREFEVDHVQGRSSHFDFVKAGKQGGRMDCVVDPAESRVFELVKKLQGARSALAAD